MITLKEAKNYLRVDYEEDDSLIQNLLSTAKNQVVAVLCHPLSHLFSHREEVGVDILIC